LCKKKERTTVIRLNLANKAILRVQLSKTIEKIHFGSQAVLLVHDYP